MVAIASYILQLLAAILPAAAYRIATSRPGQQAIKDVIKLWPAAGQTIKTAIHSLDTYLAANEAYQEAIKFQQQLEVTIEDYNAYDNANINYETALTNYNEFMIEYRNMSMNDKKGYRGYKQALEIAKSFYYNRKNTKFNIYMESLDNLIEQANKTLKAFTEVKTAVKK